MNPHQALHVVQAAVLTSVKRLAQPRQSDQYVGPKRLSHTHPLLRPTWERSAGDKLAGLSTQGSTMGILSNILGKLFPSSHAANATTPATSSTPAAPAASTSTPTPSVPSASPATVAAPQPMAQVDVEQQLDAMVASSGEKLNWKTSIVDLLKLLQLDSSLASRKELASELNYTGDMSDSASMNIWLHRQVMNKVAANGGKVPADLKD